jgi:hypothetical protein
MTAKIEKNGPKGIMKKFYKLMIFTMFVGSLQGNGDVCDKIKHINPNASQEEYRSLVKEILESGESICSCISQKCNEKVEEKIQGLAKEWKITDQQLDDIREFVKKIAEKDSKEGELFVEIDPQLHLSSEEVSFITKLFKEVGYRNGSVCVLNTKRNVEIRRIFSVDYDDILKKINNIDVKSYELYINSSWFDSSESLRGGLLHEIKGHAGHYDMINDRLLFLNARAENQDLYDDNLSYAESLYYQKYKRALEKRADRMPAACGAVEDAKSIYTSLKDLKEQWSEDQLKIEEKSSHPTAEKRLAWATRILNLKKAEEELKKDIKSL